LRRFVNFYKFPSPITHIKWLLLLSSLIVFILFCFVFFLFENPDNFGLLPVSFCLKFCVLCGECTGVQCSCSLVVNKTININVFVPCFYKYILLLNRYFGKNSVILSVFLNFIILFVVGFLLLFCMYCCTAFSWMYNRINIYKYIIYINLFIFFSSKVFSFFNLHFSCLLFFIFFFVTYSLHVFSFYNRFHIAWLTTIWNGGKAMLLVRKSQVGIYKKWKSLIWYMAQLLKHLKK